MATTISFPEGRWEGGHDLSPSLLAERRNVAMAIPIPLPKGSWEGGHDLSPSLLGEESLPSLYELYIEAA